ncbi:MAG: hypothetical protein HYX94_07870 [Chloroflexi bacterium]|nr:hypothetical protein [Chloroflexota bacterium]
MLRFALLLSLILAIVPAASVASADRSSTITMEIEAGFDGYYKIGEWFPVAVTLSNNGPDVEGKVWLEVADEMGGKTRYARSLSLPSRSRKRVHLFAFSTGFLRDVEVNLEAGGEAHSSSNATLRPLQPNDFLVGVISGDPTTGNFLSGAKLPSSPGQGEGRISVARTSLSQIPPRSQAIRSLDVLIFNDISTAELGEEQRQAIEGWVSAGGTLLVGGGAGGEKTVAGLKSLLSFRLSGARSLQSASGLEVLAGTRISAFGPFLASVAGEPGRGTVMAAQDGVPLVIQRGLGQGRVVFLAFDISLPPLNSWLEDGLLWKRLLVSGSSSASASSMSKRTGAAFGMQNALTNIPSMDLPSVVYLGIFLLVYILAIGPVNYLVLRRIDRREWAWVTIPALTLLFTGAAYTIGFGAKGGDIIVHEVAVLRSSYDASSASVESYIGVFSPARRTYQLEVGSEALLSESWRPGPAGIASQLEILQGDPGQIKNVNVNAWAMQPFLAEGFVGIEGSEVRSDLRVDGDRIRGKLINATGENLEDVVLLSGAKVSRIGALKANETMEIDVAFENSQPVWRPSMGSLILDGPQSPPVGDDRDKMRKRMILDASFGFGGKQPETWTRGGLTLVGWKKKSPLAIDLVGERIVRQSTVLLLATLPVDFGDGAVSVPAGFATRSLVDLSSARVGWSPYGLMIGDGSVVIRYQLPPATAGLRISELSLHVDQAGQGPAMPNSARPIIQLFDWQQGQWVRQGNAASGVTPIARPAAFVSVSGAIEARLEAFGGGGFEVGQIDFSVKGER